MHSCSQCILNVWLVHIDNPPGATLAPLRNLNNSRWRPWWLPSTLKSKLLLKEAVVATFNDSLWRKRQNGSSTGSNLEKSSRLWSTSYESHVRAIMDGPRTNISAHFNHELFLVRRSLRQRKCWRWWSDEDVLANSPAPPCVVAVHQHSCVVLFSVNAQETSVSTPKL